MKYINVVGAAIIKDGKLFVAQRPEGKEVGLKWEFPGGKIEEGETPKQALEREILEELGTYVEVNNYIATVRHQYPTFHLTMQVFRCTLTGPEPILTEHVASKWITAPEIGNLDWAPADYKILDAVQQCLLSSGQNP